MPKHTPGPWAQVNAQVYGAFGERICSASSREDAKLIAAAPDMAKALQAASALLRDIGTNGKLALYNAEKVYQLAQTALDKAGL